MRITKTQGAAAAVSIAAAVALAWAFSPRPVEVETAAVGRGRYEQSMEEDGRTRVRDRYTISAPVAAQLRRIGLREGDPVHAGDLVAVLAPVMPPMIDERSMREARARWHAAESAVTAASARLAKARVSHEEAKLELARTARLAMEGFVSPSRHDGARLALDAAGEELGAAQAAREVAVHERTQASAAAAPSGGAASGRLVELRSPVDGVVLKVPIQSEATVAAGTPLADVGDPSKLEVVADLLTSDAVAATPRTRAVLERWGGPPVEARVRKVEPAAFTKVSALGVEEQRVNVIIDPDRVPPGWRSVGDGFRVAVRIVTASEDDAVQVPVGALVPAEGGSLAVYVVSKGRAELRRISLFGRNQSSGWVRDGLSPGEQVIIYPPPQVSDGRRVRVRAR